MQSVSSVESILSSSDFREFLKSGVKILKESNVVNSQRTRKQNKMGFLGRVRSDDTKKAEVSFCMQCNSTDILMC